MHRGVDFVAPGAFHALYSENNGQAQTNSLGCPKRIDCADLRDKAVPVVWRIRVISYDAAVVQGIMEARGSNHF